MLNRYEYKYFNFSGNYTEDGREFKAKEHILLQNETKRRENPIAEEVSNFLREEYLDEDKNRKLFDEIKDITEPRQIENLMAGSFNLINTLIERSRIGTGAEVLLFLDKSARNGAYVFRCVWEELNRKGELPTSLILPEIRFMNIGLHDDDKHENSTPLFLLKKKYTDEAFKNKKIVIVDEYVSSGGTMKKAMKTIEEVFGVTPYGIALFERLPEWYGSDESGILGVTDFETNRRYNKLKPVLEKIDVSVAEALWKLYCNQPKEQFIEVVDRIRYGSKKNVLAKLVSNFVKEETNAFLPPNDRKLLINFATENDFVLGDSEHIWQFIDSAGSFTSRRIQDEELNKNGRCYRTVLKTMVSLYMFERMMEKFIAI